MVVWINATPTCTNSNSLYLLRILSKREGGQHVAIYLYPGWHKLPRPSTGSSYVTSYKFWYFHLLFCGVVFSATTENRQRNVKQDKAMDRAGTLPVNLYKTETVAVLKPGKLRWREVRAKVVSWLIQWGCQFIIRGSFRLSDIDTVSEVGEVDRSWNNTEHDPLIRPS